MWALDTNGVVSIALLFSAKKEILVMLTCPAYRHMPGNSQQPHREAQLPLHCPPMPRRYGGENHLRNTGGMARQEVEDGEAQWSARIRKAEFRSTPEKEEGSWISPFSLPSL